jgi:hypothetical protein
MIKTLERLWADVIPVETGKHKPEFCGINFLLNLGI